MACFILALLSIFISSFLGKLCFARVETPFIRLGKHLTRAKTHPDSVPKP